MSMRGHTENNAQPLEIERKFLLTRLPENLSCYPHGVIEQAYISVKPVIRIRREGEACTLTCKGKGHMARAEFNLPIDREAYERLLAKCEGTRIVKTRYRIPMSEYSARPEDEGLTIELDVFDAPFTGLVLAEVEFSSEEAADAFPPPAGFGAEVTGDRRFHNAWLSAHPEGYVTNP